MKRLRVPSAAVVGAAVLIAAVLGACGAGTASSDGRLEVVAAFYPIEFVATRVGGALVSVTDLTPPGAEPHDLELKPSDVRTVRSADLVLYLGKGFQPALDDATKTMPNPDRAVDLLSGLTLNAPAEGQESGPSVDPHVWLSPPLMKRIVDTAAGAIGSRLTGHGAEVDLRAKALQTELGALDAEFRAGLSQCARHEIFTSHSAFGYLAERYGLKQIAITGLSPEAEPSSKRLQEVAAQAKKSGATTIFFETLVSPRVSAAVARIVGAKVAVLNPIEGLTKGDRASGDDYFTLMRANLRALQEALGCKK